MNLTPWELWDRYTALRRRGAATLRRPRRCSSARSQRPGGREHPGLLHLYVHLMEMSPFPERALPVADGLRGAGPRRRPPRAHADAHRRAVRRLPEHGRRRTCARSRSDEKYVAREGRIGFYTLYHAHDRHFAIYGAMFLGRSQVALAIAADLEASLPEELLRIEQPPMADYLEAFVPMRVHVLIRFGLWEDILALPLPADPELYCTTTAMTHYAQGVALRRDRADGARPRRRATRSSPPSRACPTRATCSTTPARTSSPSPGRCSTASSSTGSGRVRRGVRAPAPGDRARRRAALRRAVGLDAADAPRLRRAAARAGPGRGGRSGLRRGPGLRPADPALVAGTPGTSGACTATTSASSGWAGPSAARIVKQQLDVALARADVPIKPSCFCRLSAVHSCH